MKHRIFISVMLVGIMLMNVITATASENKTYYLTDPANDFGYHVEINDDLITVNNDSSTIGYTKLKDVFSLSICNNILTLYTIDSINGILGVFYFDFYGDAIDSTALNAVFFDNPNCFASDGLQRVYYVSGTDTRKVCVYRNRSLEEINLKSQIKQLLCIDADSVIAITNDNVFLLSGTDAAKVFDSTLSEPVSYIGNNMVKDINGNKYICSDNSFVEYTDVAEGTESEAASVGSSEVSQGEVPDFYLADAGITVSKIKKAFAGFEVSKVTKANGNDIKSGKLGTGAKVYFADGNETIIIIRGELTGEGNINSRDVKAILNHLSTKELLKGDRLIAADVNDDGVVDTKDALLIARMY